MNFLKQNWVAMIAVVIAIVACFLPVLPNGKSVFGAVSTSCSGYTSCLSDLYVNTVGGGTGSIQTDGSVKISSTGTAINRINTGTCNLNVGTSTPITIAATSSLAVDCQGSNGLADVTMLQAGTALTGVTVGDTVVMTAPSTTPMTYYGLVFAGASASTTAGHIVVKINNLTGTTFTFASTSANGWQYVVTH